MNAGGSMCSGDCSLLYVVFYWQQWVTVAAMAVSLMTIPFRESTSEKVWAALGLAFGFFVLWSGGWYTAGVHPWT